jgi:hypothetical protein
MKTLTDVVIGVNAFNNASILRLTPPLTLASPLLRIKCVQKKLSNQVL